MAQSAIIQIQTQVGKISNELLIASLGGVFLALLSQVAFPIPFTPIPVTLQTLAVFLLAGFLGSKRAATSVIAYLAQGSVGLPVFAGGLANPLWFLDPKAGFLVSFIAAAFLIGKLVEKRCNPPFIYFLSALTLGQIVMFAIGAGWLSFFVGMDKAIAFGVVPFISGAMLKIVVASLLLKARTTLSK